MTEQQHPITPPPELVAQIHSDALRGSAGQLDYELRMIHAAFRSGADQELEACEEWMRSHFHGVSQWADQLRATRRPKPPSLAEQALKTLYSMQIDPVVINGINVNADVMAKYATIRCALERLQELEGKQ